MQCLSLEPISPQSLACVHNVADTDNHGLEGLVKDTGGTSGFSSECDDEGI